MQNVLRGNSISERKLRLSEARLWSVRVVSWLHHRMCRVTKWATLGVAKITYYNGLC